MPPKIALSGQAREIRKNRLKKVAKYKLHSQHKKALKEAGAAVLLQAADSTRVSREPPKRELPKKSAVAAARGSWERSQVDVIAVREAAQAAKAERLDAQELARKRRSEQAVKLKKRTKRGQPVLGNLVDSMLEKLRGGR